MVTTANGAASALALGGNRGGYRQLGSHRCPVASQHLILGQRARPIFGEQMVQGALQIEDPYPAGHVAKGYRFFRYMAVYYFFTCGSSGQPASHPSQR